MEVLLVFLAGFVAGALVVWLLLRQNREVFAQFARDMYQQNAAEKSQDAEQLVARVREMFGSVAAEALSRNTAEFLRVAEYSLDKKAQLTDSQLEQKKNQIGQSIDEVRREMQRVEQLLQSLERERGQQFSQIAFQLKNTAEQTAYLQDITQKLHSTLANSRTRGQWGERMAEDILRMAGMIEGVNYLKQQQVSDFNTRPDFTFLLPNGMKLNMDVKFPLDNYLRLANAEDATERKRLAEQFLRDVRNRIKEVTTRDYINPTDKTLDYVIVFIPNEQIYSFLHELDFTFSDDALRQKVVVCSPFTLYAVLAVIRQAIENFKFEQTAAELLDVMANFKKQWKMFQESMEKAGRKIDEAQREFNTLSTTRRRMLDRSLERLEDLQDNGLLEPRRNNPPQLNDGDLFS